MVMYRYCDVVQVVSVDRWGLQGREVEPPRAVEGKYGVVLNTDIEDLDGEMPLVIHTVMMDGTGAMYEFADYELN